MENSFKLKTVQNVGYNAFGKAIAMLFQFAASIVLARNLASSDYGIAGFALILTSFIAPFADMGVQTAVIRAGELDEKGLYTGFAIKALLGITLFAATYILAPLGGLIFHNAAVNSAIKLLSLNFFINSFVFLPTVLLNRELNFRKQLAPQTMSVVANSIVSIIMARNGYGYWSIIWGNVCSTAVFAVVVNYIHPVKVRFQYDGAQAAGFFRFGRNLLASGLLVCIIVSVDNFMIGIVRGAGVLGYYSVAFNWGSMTSYVLNGVVLSVLLPTFAKFQADRARLKNAYLRVLGDISFLGLLTNVGLLLVSREFLFLVLGRNSGKWLPALASLKILCVYGIIRTVLEPVVSVLVAIGKSAPLLKAQVVMAAAELALLYPALKYFGIEGAAIVVTAAYSLAYFVLFPVLNRELRLGLAEWARPVLPPLVSASVSAALVLALRPLFSFSLYGMAGKLLLFSGVYCGLHGILTKWRVLREVREILSEFRPAISADKQ